jgi:hypothetical protein
MTNETRQPNANKRRRTFTEVPVFTEFSDAVTALITACLEVAPREEKAPRQLMKKAVFLNEF